MVNANRANGTQVWGKTTAPDRSVLITISRLIRDTSDSSRHLGYVKVVVSTDEIRNLLRSSNDIPGVSYYVIDADDQEVADSDNAQPYSKLKDYFQHNLAGEGNAKTAAVTISGGLFYISAAQIQKTPYILYSITSAALALDIQSALLKGVSFTAVMLILFGVIFSVVLSKWLVRPLQTLSSMTETVAAGDFSRRISISGNDEIAALARQFNKMTMELKNLYNKVYASKLKQQQAEYSALLAKINPHFLLNTLDAIYWMAQSDKNERVAKMVSALSGMMRYTISGDDHGGMILLQQETDCLKSYLYIQRVRYGDNIQFLLTMEPGLENCLVLKLILQPLVENAIVHGVAPVGNGIVDVLIYRDAEQLIYEIRNTGHLADTKKLQKVLSAPPNGTKGFALRNISDRLHLKFGESGKIEAQSDGVQTIFKVTQPNLFQPSDTKTETNASQAETDTAGEETHDSFINR